MQRGDEHEIPFKTLGFVNGHQLYCCIGCAGFGVERAQPAIQKREAGGVLAALAFVEQIQEAQGIGPFMRLQGGVAPQGAPGALDVGAERSTAEILPCLLENVPGTGEACPAIQAHAVRAGRDPMQKGVMYVRFGTVPGEREQVRQCETADRRAEDGQPGDAVCRAEQGAGEREQIEDLGSLV